MARLPLCKKQNKALYDSTVVDQGGRRLDVAAPLSLVNMSTQTQWHWNLLPSVILIEILAYLPLCDRISACSTCKAWRSALFHPNFWRRIELVFVAGEWRRLERSRFVASWAARKLRSCVIHFETVNTNCLVEVDHVLLKITRNPQVSGGYPSNTSLGLLISPIYCHQLWNLFPVSSISCVIVLLFLSHGRIFLCFITVLFFFSLKTHEQHLKSPMIMFQGLVSF